VLLLEAGPIFATDRYPPVLTDANIVAGVSALPSFDWQYHTDGVGRLGHDNRTPGSRDWWQLSRKRRSRDARALA
jgi:hypothetical protein